jgi:hypothetical protein
MKTDSAKINELGRVAASFGCKYLSVDEGWSNVRQVLYMGGTINDAIRNRAKELELRHWADQGSPFFPPSEGYTDDSTSCAIAFQL